MKKHMLPVAAVILAIVICGFNNVKKNDTYFFAFDATGQHIIYPQYPNFPPTSNPFSCNAPFEVRCVAEYSSYTINPHTWPFEFWPDGILLAQYYKPMPF